MLSLISTNSLSARDEGKKRKPETHPNQKNENRDRKLSKTYNLNGEYIQFD